MEPKVCSQITRNTGSQYKIETNLYVTMYEPVEGASGT